MKNLFAIVLIFVGLSACDKDTPTSDTNIDATTVNTVGLGEACGGLTENFCKSGLKCNNQNPQDEGTCISTVVDEDIECPKTQSPVCGKIGNNKNGYLNECEAKRHGAEILYNGLCKADETVTNNCDAEPISMGNCEAWFEGAYFDKDSNTCKNIGLSGCSADIPFPNIEACQKSCGGSKEKPNTPVTDINSKVPENCISFYDGCNTCGAKDGELTFCTKKYCATPGPTKCLKYDKNPSLIQECPEEKINNLMPPVPPIPHDRSYYIYQGTRYEIDEFDADWVKANCDVQEMNVY